MSEEIYRVADLMVHYAKYHSRRLGENESFAATPEELEDSLRKIVQELRAAHPDSAPSFWSEFETTEEGAIADAFARTFRCAHTKEGRIVFIDNPPGLPDDQYKIGKQTQLASELFQRLYLDAAPLRTDLDN